MPIYEELDKNRGMWHTLVTELWGQYVPEKHIVRALVGAVVLLDSRMAVDLGEVVRYAEDLLAAVKATRRPAKGV